MDYKWGSGTARLRFEADVILQLPLYAAVAEKVLGAPVVAGLYRGLSDGSARGWWLDGPAEESTGLVGNDRVSEEEARGILERASERAVRAAEGIRAGAIDPGAAASSACVYCSAAAFCPKEAAG
jgi:hypothetical protein